MSDSDRNIGFTRCDHFDIAAGAIFPPAHSTVVRKGQNEDRTGLEMPLSPCIAGSPGGITSISSNARGSGIIAEEISLNPADWKLAGVPHVQTP